ncbi:nitrite reductase [Streptomyces hygroscopicus]|uniref:nitrite reductase n=1 Tax=Streptomyces hygroscopicus TaxID=1912 RepID=UPI001FCD1802|nr:nitrite reductase [Streptomyces hygroscopicus]
MPLPPTTTPSGDEPPIRGRDDACPGALRLHPADDGSLARIRVPGGLLTARQATVVGRVAEELGDGRLDITSRGNLQVRGLEAGCGAELAARLRTAGLLPSDRHDRVRNVVASPLSGLDGEGYADVTGWVRELDAVLCGGTPAEHGELSGLSGRFLFALDDGRGDVATLGADVTLIATPDGGALLRMAATACRAGGAEGGDTPRAVLWVRGGDAPRAAALAAAEFLTRARESGTRAWRVRELPAQHAVTTEGVAARLAAAGIDAVPRPDAPGPQTPQPPPAPGLVTGPEGRHAVSVAVPLGRADADQWRLLTALASRSGADELRMTPWRGVVLPGLSPDGARDACSALSEAGLVTAPDSPWLGVGACTGRPGCAKSLADVRADTARMVADTERAAGGTAWGAAGAERRAGDTARGAAGAGRVAGDTAPGDDRDEPGPGTGIGPDPGLIPEPSPDPGLVPEPGPEPGPGPGTAPLPVYVSGCERRCGHPGGRWVDALATGDAGYRIAVRGAGRDTPEADSVDVTAEQLAGAVAAARGTT